jgi:uncharacterized repeat protein (TIGR01451 family)
MMIVAMFGFAGLVFAASGAPVKQIDASAKIAKPIAVSEQDAANPPGDNTPVDNAAFVAPPANDTCVGAINLPLNRTVIATTTGANDDYQSPATTACYPGLKHTPTTAPGKDIVFSFTAPVNGKYTVRIVQQGPNADPTRTQNAVLYASDSCPASGVVNCIAGANGPQSNAFVSNTGSSSNQSEEISCLPMTAGQTIYVFFDNAQPNNAGGVTSVEVENCLASEVEPNGTPETATPYACQIAGGSSAVPVSHCYLGSKAGQLCTRTTPVDPSLKNCSLFPDKRCTTDADCVPATEGVCVLPADLDCDPRCDVGPNAGLPCLTQAFCNPVSDQGATCTGACLTESTCIDNATGARTGIACTPVCVGGLFPGRVCSSIMGCPGGGVCTTTPVVPTPGNTCTIDGTQTCSRQYNEGDEDFFSLGTPPSGSKVFAALDARGATDQDFRMRITSASKTFQFDDDDGIGRNGANAPVIGGAVTDGSPAYVKISRTTSRLSSPYELLAVVRPPLASAQLEDESGPTGNDIYFGWPGDVINANAVNNGANNGYVRGTYGFQGDSDCFKFLVNEGDLMDWFGDGNPGRLAGATAITNVPQMIIYDADNAAISNFAFGMAPGRRNITPNVAQPTLNALSPSVLSFFLEWRATYTGMLEVCYYDASSLIGLGVPNHPSPYAGSLNVNCGPLQAAGPGTTTADVSVTKTGPVGPVATGEFAEYTITTTNHGTQIAQEVRLQDTLDANLTYAGIFIDDGFGGSNTACFSLPTLGTNDASIDCINTSMAPGSTTTYTVVVQVNNCIAGGLIIDNTASITTSSTDPDASNDSATASFTTAVAANNGCTDIVCDTNTGTCFPDLCTNDDHCDAGVCVTSVVNCDDNSLCTDDSCSSEIGCVNDPSQAGDLCDDFNACTTNACDPLLFCVFPPEPSSTSCDDALNCTVADHCDGQGACVGGGPACDDGNACSDDSCDEATGCAHVPSASGTACSDGNACTVQDACDGANVCVGGTPLACDDGNACNGVETCDSVSGCVPGVPVVCAPPDQCHTAGTCQSGTGLCSYPELPDGTVCDDGNSGTSGDTCQGGVCTGTSCNTQPKPKSAGYYKKLCKGGHGHPHGGDALTNADAVCVGQLTATFAGISTVDDICAVYDHDSSASHDTNGPNGKECNNGERELMGLALNVCRDRVCLSQEVDSSCSGGPHDHTLTSVAASLAAADAILADPARNKTTCKDAKCLAKEVNNGKGLHHTSLTLNKEPGAGNKIRLNWDSPVMDDGSGEASSYTVWRRALNADAVFIRLAVTPNLTFLDATSGTGTWEYEVTFTIEP